MTHRVMRPTRLGRRKHRLASLQEEYRRRRRERRRPVDQEANAIPRAVIGSLLVILLLAFGFFLVTRRDQTSPLGDAAGVPVEHVREVRP